MYGSIPRREARRTHRAMQGCKGHAPQSQIDRPLAAQKASEPHTRHAHAVRTGLENCAWRQADVPNSTTARNPEPFLYKWVTDSLLNRFPKKGWRCDACPIRLVQSGLSNPALDSTIRQNSSKSQPATIAIAVCAASGRLRQSKSAWVRSWFRKVAPSKCCHAENVGLRPAAATRKRFSPAIDHAIASNLTSL